MGIIYLYLLNRLRRLKQVIQESQKASTAYLMQWYWRIDEYL